MKELYCEFFSTDELLASWAAPYNFCVDEVKIDDANLPEGEFVRVIDGQRVLIFSYGDAMDLARQRFETCYDKPAHRAFVEFSDSAVPAFCARRGVHVVHDPTREGSGWLWVALAIVAVYFAMWAGYLG